LFYEKLLRNPINDSRNLWVSGVKDHGGTKSIDHALTVNVADLEVCQPGSDLLQTQFRPAECL